MKFGNMKFLRKLKYCEIEKLMKLQVLEVEERAPIVGFCAESIGEVRK